MSVTSNNTITLTRGDILKVFFKKLLAHRNKFKLTLEVPRDIMSLMTNEERFKFKISSTAAALFLLHRDTKIEIDKPLKIANSFIVGKAIGVLIINTRFKKEVYN